MGTFSYMSILLLVLLAFGYSTLCVAQKLVPAVYVLGDSLVDVGNNNHLLLSYAKADFPHNGVDYPGQQATGRFCNGKNSADFIAEKLGLPTSPPYLSLSKSNMNSTILTGVSFASGGSKITNDSNTEKSISFLQQVEYFSKVHDGLVQQLGSGGAQQHLSKSIFPIVIGSNDIFGFFKAGSSLRKKGDTPQQFIDQMLLTLKSVLKRLYGLGGRKFVLTGVGPIGCTPAQRNKSNTEQCNEEQNLGAQKYNVGLKAMLQGLQVELKDIHYTYFDTYSIMLDFIQKPATHGFAEVKAACCGLGTLRAEIPCIPISVYCPNRNDHLFWDIVHPTEAAARMFVDAIFEGSQQYVTPMSLKQLIAA